MILHVACLPFPSYQGTQAALGAMLRASASTGRPTHLLTYAQAAYELEAPYEIHRIPDVPKVRSLRSGPSWGKIALDARCIVETRRLVRRLKPNAIVAHHIEAALAAIAARVTPVYYVAHTSLARELPVYFPSLPASLVSGVAKRVEERVCARAAGVAAVAPSLAELPGREARYLPVPWSLPAAVDLPTRGEARAALGLPVDAHVCLYAGNLDAYQGWEDLVAAMAKLRRSERRARLVVATASDGAPLRRAAAEAEISSALKIVDLPDAEPGRRALYAAADLAIIPRRTPGGLPIKLLDALGRGLPTVAARRAAAGLPLASAAHLTNDDDAAALAAACRVVLDAPEAAAELGRRGRAYVEDAHGGDRYVAALDAVARSAQKVSRNATRSPISSLLR